MKKRPASEDADQSGTKRQKKPVSNKRYAPELTDQIEAKRQMKVGEKDGEANVTSAMAPIVKDSAAAKRTPKNVSFAPYPEVHYISDEDQKAPSEKRFGRARQTLFDYISGVPPNPPAAKGRAKRAATLTPQSTSRSFSHAATTRSESLKAPCTAQLASLVEEGVSVVDFAYARPDIAPAGSLHLRGGDRSPFKDMEEPAAPHKTSMPLQDSKETQNTISGRASPRKSTTDKSKSARVPDNVSINRDSISTKDSKGPNRDGFNNEGTRQLPAPHKRVARLRGTAKPSGVRKKKRAKHKRPPPPPPPSRSRYGLRSERKIISYDGEGEVEVDSGQ